MTAQIWIALATANFLACLAPGQNVALMAAAVARSGPAGGGFAMLGILLAEIAWAALAIHLTFGARELAGDTYFLLQIPSAGVLIWFGFDALREGGRTAAIRLRTGIAGLVGDGVFVGFANPLALVFFLSVFPAFVPPGTNGTGAAFFFVSAIVASSAAGLVPYIVAGGMLRRAGHTNVLQWVSGGALMGAGGLLLLNITI